jgi:hypothetical protein
LPGRPLLAPPKYEFEPENMVDVLRITYRIDR